ncbi:S-layer homology domain-containing protein [Pseudobacteroides cellulosolvens]|uniref:Cellulosome anchoring protein cohesin region n=1 Tax=Pseudobacteroides cellulosolvens ATCC 35603 = DSM 2933 TaxID=398512 RepID=A0A0L6JIU5_9FIRM|nr:S-layer homology domain-containing protein [Pseudobacteroides cellulosolvens]KNY25766.1 cellulosome anchoring protein cohesin region [Pseudobacteroides cellulosolvens ATCC 35603 = DSM 2933]
MKRAVFKQLIKKLFLFSVILSVVGTNLLFTPSEASAEGGVSISIGSGTGDPEASVKIPVNISGIPSLGINNIDFELSYDSNNLEFISAIPGAIYDVPTDFSYFNTSENGVGKIKFLFSDTTQGSQPLKKEGVMVELNFKVKKSAVQGVYKIQKYEIGSCSSIDSANKKLVPVNVNFNDGAITVTNAATPTPTPSGQVPTPTATVTPTPVKVSPSAKSSTAPSSVVSNSNPVNTPISSESRVTPTSAIKATPIVLVNENKKLIPKGIPADLAITVKTDKNIYKEDEIISFKIKYLNRLDKEASNVVISAEFPAGTVPILSSIKPMGKLKDNGMEWEIDSLGIGKVGEIEYQLQVSKLPIAMTTTTAVVTIDSNDNILKNDDNKSLARFLLLKNNTVLSHKKYMNGYPDGTIKPDKEITRAEVAVLFANLLALDTSDNTTVAYQDVKKGHWALKYINAVSKAGIFKGSTVKGVSLFNPNNFITRAELATAISRYLELGENRTPLEVHFSDIVGHWSMKYVEEAYRLNIVSGYSNAKFLPNNKIKRAEVLVMLNRMSFRGPVSTDEASPFKDLSKKHWAFGHIIESTTDHNTILNGQVEIKQ